MSIFKKFFDLIEGLIEKLGEWITPAFNAAEEVYEKLTDDEKKAANYAYGVIALINQYGEEAEPYIKALYPDLSTDQLHGFLDIVLKDIGVIEDSTPITLKEALKAVADYTGTLKGDTWKVVSQSLGNLLAVLFSPTTPVQKFVAVAEMVYSLFVKPKVAALDEEHTDGDPTPTCPKGQIWNPILKKCQDDIG